MKKTLLQTHSSKTKGSTKVNLGALYEMDEVAWLEKSVRLLKQKRFDGLDYLNLEEFLDSMAKSQRREVKSRLATLMAHLLKWQFQKDQRTGSWKATIIHQRGELEDIFSSRTLKNHAIDILSKAYQRAVQEASAETGLNESAFPSDCPFSLDYLLGRQLPEGDEPE
jgi:hypothetical protein